MGYCTEKNENGKIFVIALSNHIKKTLSRYVIYITNEQKQVENDFKYIFHHIINMARLVKEFCLIYRC